MDMDDGLILDTHGVTPPAPIEEARHPLAFVTLTQLPCPRVAKAAYSLQQYAVCDAVVVEFYPRESLDHTKEAENGGAENTLKRVLFVRAPLGRSTLRAAELRECACDR